MEIKRGDIWYVDKSYYTGSEQASGRPAIIVSNDKNNENSDTVEVVYLTTQPKKDLPTHVVIRSAPKESIAICEQITTVAKERIGSFIGNVTEAEMMNIEIAMLVSLDLKMETPKEKPEEVVKEVAPGLTSESTATILTELVAARAKCEMLQTMYDILLNRVLTGKEV